MTAAALTAAIAFGVVGCKMNKDDGHGGHGAHHDHDDDSREVVITAKDVPAAVQRGFEKAYPNVQVKKIERETYKDGTVHYEYEFVGANGKEMEVELNDKGEVLEDH